MPVSPLITATAEAQRRILARIPRRVRPSRTREPERFEGSRYAPFYNDDGSLWFIMDMDEPTKRVVLPPEYGPPLPFWLHVDRWAERDPHKSRTVYFIGDPAVAIKIGFTCSLQSRFRDIQAHSPIKLETLATRKGGEHTEGAYHSEYGAHRLHGEWFAPHPDILAEIERLRSHAPEQSGMPTSGRGDRRE
jgi:hypothetical protein